MKFLITRENDAIITKIYNPALFILIMAIYMRMLILIFFYLRFIHIISCKVFKAVDGPVSKVFVQLVMTCTGGGILVPIFINGIPVS